MDATMRIAEVADRSGFSAATLRYYEKVDLLPPPQRTPAGYRVYDRSVLDRLAFIGRAKMLGCSLDEVAGLLPDWDGGRCAPVQSRLRNLAVAKLVDAEARAAELVAFAAELSRILDTLGSHTPDGPCDAECGCVNAVPPEPVAPIAVACTLDSAQLPGRVQEWQDLAGHVGGRAALDGGLRLELDATTPLDQLAQLMKAEQGCCSFLSFALTVDSRGVALEVRVPAEGNGHGRGAVRGAGLSRRPEGLKLAGISATACAACWVTPFIGGGRAACPSPP